MKIYQVGGAVRDMLRGIAPHDIDYVVVGASPQKMKDLGFIEVGRGFPVFLHPITKEEYALARKEIKTGAKHTDFKFIFDENITLREDMERRDFTCNAIAFEQETNQLIDYFGGKEDIKAKILRHINAEHFIEDPLRVLRLCRFAAQLEFEPALETLELCKVMVAKGMLFDLTPERIFEEILKALQCEKFERFFIVAKQIGALKVILPEVDEIFELSRLKRAKHTEAIVKFALIISLLKDPSAIKEIAKRLKIPTRFVTFFNLVHRLMSIFDRIDVSDLEQLYDFSVALTINHTNYINDFFQFLEAYKGRKFEKEKQRVMHICSENQKIKATDMPNFDKIPKDKDFAQILKVYKISVLKNIESIVEK